MGERNVFLWLDGMRVRPGMYLRNKSLQDLETLLPGYYSGLGVHGIVEAVPAMHHFRDWLYIRTGWSCSRGWAHAIEQRHKDPEKALATFFGLVDEYRQLRPTPLCTVRLGAKHNPTGKRVRYGFDGLMDKPRRVEVIRYRPAPLHFVRFHYRDRVEDGDVLMTGSGEYTTTLRYAKQWVSDTCKSGFRSGSRPQRAAVKGEFAVVPMSGGLRFVEVVPDNRQPTSASSVACPRPARRGR